MVILSTNPGGGTGAYMMLNYFLEAAADWDDKPTLVVPGSSDVYANAVRLGFPTLDLGVRRDRLATNLPAIARLFKQLNHARGVCAWHTRGFEMALFLGKRLGIPAVAIYHDPPDSPSHGALRQQLMRWDTRRFDMRIFVSHATQAQWTPWIQSGTNLVIHNGLPDRDLTRSTVPDGKVRVGFLGMYTRHKGFPLLLDWIEKTAGELVRWHLYGDLARDLAGPARQIAARFPDTVALCGRKSPEAIFREVDILVQPSTSFDPFPTVLLEAARAGIPVVSSNLGGSPEIVLEGRTGYLFDPRHPATGLEALLRLIRHEDQRLRMGARAREQFQQHLRIAPMAEAYARAWETLCHAHR